MDDNSQISRDANNQLDRNWAMQEINRLRKENAEMKAERQQGFTYNQMPPAPDGARPAGPGGQIVMTDDGRAMSFEDASKAIRAQIIAEAIQEGMSKVMRGLSDCSAKAAVAAAFADAVTVYIESKEG